MDEQDAVVSVELLNVARETCDRIRADNDRLRAERDAWKARYEKAITERGVLFTQDAIEAKTIERCAQEVYRKYPELMKANNVGHHLAEAIRALKPSE